MSGKLALVTGVTGFVAGQVAEALLEKGYRVRGTVRSAKFKSISESVKVPGLEFTEVDDLAAGDLTEALKGVDVVVHVAAPLPGKADAETSIKTSVEGTLNVIRQAEKLGITKIVATSTFGNCFHPSLNTAYGGVTVTDADWGKTSKEEILAKPEDYFHSYFAAKNLAERALWEFAEAHPHLDITSILPGFIYGPYSKIIPKPANAGGLSSNIFVYMLLNGTFPDAAMAPGWVVDVRDIAKAHVAAIDLPRFTPASTKRFLINSGNIEWNEAAEYARKAAPELKSLPAAETYKGIPGPLAILDSTRAKEVLKLDTLIEPKQTILDALLDINALQATWPAAAA